MQCDFCNLKVKIRSPSGHRLPYKFENVNSVTKFRIIPKEKGMHRISIKLGNEHIKSKNFARDYAGEYFKTYLIFENSKIDSPLQLDAIESPTPCVYGDGLYNGILNKPIAFFVNTPKYIEGNLNIEIKDPENFHVKTCIQKLTENIYEIKYVPLKVGLFTITIHYNSLLIKNSPFIVRVVNLEKIKILNEFDAIFRSISNSKTFTFDLNVEKCLCFDTSEAGPGKIIVSY